MNTPAQPQKPIEYIYDEQTGDRFPKSTEKWYDTVAAWASAVYLLAVLLFLGWQLLDIWIGQYTLLGAYPNKGSLGSPIFKLLAYTAIGGGLGGVVNGLRSLISWHSERQSFGVRFIWKYLSLPPLGATLAVMVYGLMRGGIAVFSGGFTGDANTVSSLTALALGSLAGYGSHQVFIWLDQQVNKLFVVVSIERVKTPNLIDKTQAEADQLLQGAKLKLGKAVPEVSPDKEGLVIRQEPAAETVINSGATVDIVIATKSA